MLQGVGEDGENMRNLLFSVFSRFSLLLPFLSPTSEEINPHGFRFSMQTWEEIPTVPVLLAGNRGGGGLAPWAPRCPTPRGCVSDAPAEPAPSTDWPRDHGDTSDFCSAPPHPFVLLLMICQLSSSSLQKPWRHLHFFPYRRTGWRLTDFQAEPRKRLQSDLVPHTHTSAAVTARYRNRN